jgi:hypothetical protein
LARVFVLSHWNDVPAFQTDYKITWQITPNLALDAAIAALHRFLPIMLAGKVFLLTVVFLWALGCHMLGTAIHGGRTWMAIPCVLLACHSGFQYGFVNYAFSLAVFFIGFALWLRWRHVWSPARVAAVASLVCAAYLSHLSGFVMFGASAASAAFYELCRGRMRFRDAVAGGLAFLPALLLFALYTRAGGARASIEGADIPTVVWNSAPGKIVALFSMVRGYDIKMDLVVVVLLFGSAAIAAVAAYRNRGIAAEGAALTAAAVLFLLFLALPRDLLSVSGVDARLGIPAVVLAVLSLNIRLSPTVAVPVFGAALIALCARTAAIGWTWAGLDSRIARSVALFEHLPERARVLPLFAERPRFLGLDPARSAGVDAIKADHVLEHVPFYAVITRHAYVPMMFAVRGQQPVLQLRHVYQQTNGRRLLRENLADFDYVSVFGPVPDIGDRLKACCSLQLSERDGFSIWKVERP